LYALFNDLVRLATLDDTGLSGSMTDGGEAASAAS